MAFTAGYVLKQLAVGGSGAALLAIEYSHCNVTQRRPVTKARAMVFPCALCPASTMRASGEVMRLLQLHIVEVREWDSWRCCSLPVMPHWSWGQMRQT